MRQLTRRAIFGAAAGLACGAAAPAGLRLATPSSQSKQVLWSRQDGPRLRGAVFAQRRVYANLDGSRFLGSGPVGAPVTDGALSALARSGANLASWSGPGPFGETAPFDADPAIEDHIGAWLDRCQAHGLFTTLCFRSGPGRSAFAFHPDETWYPSALYDASLWRDADKQEAWAQMTAWTLARFGAHPALGGVLAMDEPNGADLGYPDVWPRLAARIADVSRDVHADTPLLLSPDRWARQEAAPALREAVGAGPVLVTHDYSPWRYTHPGDSPPQRFRPGQAGPAPGRELGAAAVLEFGAPRSARNLGGYLRDRINAYETAGLNWAVFRWTSGWAPYEARESARALSEDPAALAVLREAFSANIVRPGAR